MRDRKHPAADAPPRSFFLRVRGPAPVTFRVDPAGLSKAMALGPHASITHLERVVPERVRPALGPIAHAIAEASSHLEAGRASVEVLASHGLEVDRRDEPRVSIRKHPAGRLREGSVHRLIDHELLGLSSGVRAVAKRMCPPGGAADRASRFESMGFAATWFGVTTHGAHAAEREVILVARDRHTLEHAARVERALVEASRDRTDDAEIVREMGDLLGYPRCCVERFVSLRARDDASLAGALLGALEAPSPFATSFTVPPFVLISHAPCSPECGATVALVERILASTDSPTREAYASLARFAWGVDEQGWLVRTRDGASERIDPSDAELSAQPIETPDRSSLHWRLTPRA